MTLRTKLFLPILLFSLLLAAYAEFGWLPQYLHFIERQDRAHRVEHLRSVAEGLVPLLLENQLATVYDSLDSLQKNNQDWMSIQLYNTKHDLLYPFIEPKESVQSGNQYTLEQRITYLDHELGLLVLTVDNTSMVLSVEGLQRFFLLVLFSLLALFISAIVATLEFVVRRPVNQLAIASDRLAQGEFEAKLPAPRGDEVGRLVKSFAAMRDAIKRFQSDLRDEKERFSYHASHDALTGLLNRREFERRVAMVLTRADEDQVQHVLMYMDLDQFKVVNDTCGHIAGDELLRQLGTLLSSKIRKGDTLARLGGDEFGVLLEYCSDQKAIAIAEELREAIQDFRFSWEDRIFTLGVSIGVVPVTGDVDNMAVILSKADSACYAAKDKGRNRIHMFEQNDEELVKRHGEMQWITKITSALQQGRFTLYSQPVVPLENIEGSVEYHELLLRMIDEEGEIITPGAFLPAAERYNLMSAVDRWTTEAAFRYAGEMRTHPSYSEQMYGINLSGSSLGDDNMFEFIKTRFLKFGVNPSTICFEITETEAISNLVKASNFIKELKGLGCYFALDDFGSGLCSFGYLKNLPVDYLKIDGLFVKDIVQDPIDLAMVKSINDVGHIMGMKTIAEFVESEEILALLQDLKVDFVQGYAIQRPQPLILFDARNASVKISGL